MSLSYRFRRCSVIGSAGGSYAVSAHLRMAASRGNTDLQLESPTAKRLLPCFIVAIQVLILFGFSFSKVNWAAASPPRYIADLRALTTRSNPLPKGALPLSPPLFRTAFKRFPRNSSYAFYGSSFPAAFALLVSFPYFVKACIALIIPCWAIITVSLIAFSSPAASPLSL